ncbi:acetate--CoA ligase family protein [Aquamicrobium sp. LC103]|uniref:acetate--CoA ligase family protein n=1 Tax=Aquamicrobium sp. LC103 TaxID=1120658 RepID=UPI00063EC121|nr:acetate--CoA ligase family protein [Aquamicrobium sp. LC103]TKT74508.1 acetate--CoA ligase family protein [Aquamicrobium sp. LC103]
MLEGIKAGPRSRDAIAGLFETRALAIVGATPDAGKLGSAPMAAMRNLGFQGEIFGVNPRYEEVQGFPCVESVADLPKHVTAAMVLVSAEPAMEVVERCGARGIRSIVLIPQGFGEAGGVGLERDERILAAADKYGMAIVGPNTNGISNVATGMAMSMGPIFAMNDKVKPGRVSVVSQSGAMVSNMLSKMGARGIGIAKTATCGNELVLTMADYLGYIADDPETDVVVLLVETIRDREGLRNALARCRASGKPVVAVKTGESEMGQKATLSHTGAIAGSFKNTVAFLEREGVIVASDIEMMAAAVELLVRHKWPLETPQRIGMVSISGGFAALAADEMARLGLSLGELSANAVAELQQLPNQSHAINPYDFAAQNAIIPSVLDIFRRDGYNQLVFGLSLLKDGIRETVQKMVIDAKKAGYDQIYVVSPETEPDEKAVFQEAGITVSEDTRPLFDAMRVLGRWRGPSAAVAEPIRSDWVSVDLPAADGLMDEVASKAVLAELGLKIPVSRVVGTTPDLLAIEGLSRPLVIKGLSKTIAHKTEHGIVALGLKNDEEITAGWKKVAEGLARADPSSDRLLVEEMSSSGLEAIVGMQNDPAVGPVIIIGAGGILVELIADAAILIPPFTREEVLEKLDRTRFGTLLRGYRGKVFDREALADAAVALGRLALSEPRLDSIDINPVFVHERGVVAVDGKITLKS